MSIPIWLLDVDGVVNAIDPNAHEWPDFTHYTSAGKRSYRIRYSPTLVSQIAEIHHSGQAEIWWLTTWMNDANLHLADLFGLPELIVANTFEEYSLASGEWWKLAVAQRIYYDHGRRLIWTDDDISGDPAAKQWSAGNPNILAISPDSLRGLTPAHLQQIRRWL